MCAPTSTMSERSRQVARMPWRRTAVRSWQCVPIDPVPRDVPQIRQKALTAARATPNGMDPPLKAGIIQTMYEHVIQQALWDVQDLLCANLALRHGNLPDDRA